VTTGSGWPPRPATIAARDRGPHHSAGVNRHAQRPPAVYEMERAVAANSRGGAHVVQTVYDRMPPYWDRDAPVHLQSVGETRTVAQEWGTDPGVRHKSMGLSRSTELVLRPQAARGSRRPRWPQGRGCFKGIRNSGPRDAERASRHSPDVDVLGQREYGGTTDFVRGVRDFGATAD